MGSVIYRSKGGQESMLLVCETKQVRARSRIETRGWQGEIE